ncbi:Actin family [Phytophthora cactorum]|nr:Actin family [Phytophthora cactorum]
MYAGGGANEGDHHSSGNAPSRAQQLKQMTWMRWCSSWHDFPRVFERPVPHDEVQDDAELGRHLNRRSAQVESDPEKLAQWLFDASSSRLQTRLSEHPLLLVERPFTLPEEVTGDAGQTQDEQDDAGSRTTETKTLGVPALFCAKSAVLACYANARTSGLVVEMGATYTSVTSVQEGYAFAYPKSQVTLFGGHDLDAFLRTKLAPQRKKQTWSYVVEAKESGLCRVADGPFDEVQNAQLPLINYELPDKTIVSLGTERFSVAEHYFLGGTVPKAATTGGLTTETELRKELFQNIVLTGGSSCFENMPTRIEREVVTTIGNNGAAGGYTSSLRVKVVAAHPQERRVGSFLGGSILASLGSFHEMWMSKAEYAEHGATLIHKKCP